MIFDLLLSVAWNKKSLKQGRQTILNNIVRDREQSVSEASRLNACARCSRRWLPAILAEVARGRSVPPRRYENFVFNGFRMCNFIAFWSKVAINSHQIIEKIYMGLMVDHAHLYLCWGYYIRVSHCMAFFWGSPSKMFKNVFSAVLFFLFSVVFSPEERQRTPLWKSTNLIRVQEISVIKVYDSWVMGVGVGRSPWAGVCKRHKKEAENQ